jgi:pSer/pThr/pTyr-binding forkhead associated (FHA) protein
MTEFTIGREGCDILLDSPYVSAHHARLMLDEDGGLSIADAQSRNGTFLLHAGGVETRITTTPVQVSLRSVLRFADERLRVRDLMVQLLEHRPKARVQLAQSWLGPEADDLLQRYGGRQGIKQIKPPSPPPNKTGKVRIDPETGKLIHE